MRYLLLITILISPIAKAEFLWDIPVENFSKVTGTIFIRDLKVGDVANFSEYAVFCTKDNNILAIDGLTEVGDGDYQVKMLPGNLIDIQVPDEEEFLNLQIESGSNAQCSFWMADKGKYVISVNTINGKKKLSHLNKNRVSPLFKREY